MSPIREILLFMALSLGVSSHAEVITLPSEQEINVEEYGDSSSDKLILWLTSERGISAELQKTVLAISEQQQLHILMPDLHDSYFLSPTRSSLEKIPGQDYEDLISHYTKQHNKLFLVASGRAAGLALKTAHHLQSKNIHSIAGIILFSPYLQKQTPEIGQQIEYQQIASFSNLPLYIFQAERSPRFVPFPMLIKVLEKGGSQVYSHILKGITGGFHRRNKADLGDQDLAALQALPRQFKNALSMLEQSDIAPLIPLQNYEIIKSKKNQLHLQHVQLQTPALELHDLAGKPHKLTDYKGKTVIVSFWASWCRPCIEEMPSLVKLKQQNSNKLEILAVNVREGSQTIKKFTGSMNINFPLLQDHDSSTTDDWRVYVYPSNYIVDKTGKLRYAATGALDWQESEIQKLLESLD